MIIRIVLCENNKLWFVWAKQISVFYHLFIDCYLTELNQNSKRKRSHITNNLAYTTCISCNILSFSNSTHHLFHPFYHVTLIRWYSKYDSWRNSTNFPSTANCCACILRATIWRLYDVLWSSEYLNNRKNFSNIQLSENTWLLQSDKWN